MLTEDQRLSRSKTAQAIEHFSNELARIEAVDRKGTEHLCDVQDGLRELAFAVEGPRGDDPDPFDRLQATKETRKTQEKRRLTVPRIWVWVVMFIVTTAVQVFAFSLLLVRMIPPVALMLILYLTGGLEFLYELFHSLRN